jgi:hypothetical protein
MNLNKCFCYHFSYSNPMSWTQIKKPRDALLVMWFHLRIMLKDSTVTFKSTHKYPKPVHFQKLVIRVAYATRMHARRAGCISKHRHSSRIVTSCTSAHRNTSKKGTRRLNLHYDTTTWCARCKNEKNDSADYELHFRREIYSAVSLTTAAAR